MSDQKDQGRRAWVRGDAPQDPNDEFAKHAARGRKELGSEQEADDLLRELDSLLAERYGAATGSGPEDLRGAAQQDQRQSKPATIRRLPRLYAIAVAILLLIAVGWWWSQRQRTTTFDAEAVYAEAFEPYANDLGGRAMGGDDPDSLAGDPTLAAAILAYDRRDFAAAADSFAVYQKLAPASAPVSLYHGISLLAAGKPAAAGPLLQTVTDDTTYAAPAAWYKALALLRSGDTAGAKVALEAIAKDSSSPFRQAAQKLLPDIP